MVQLKELAWIPRRTGWFITFIAYVPVMSRIVMPMSLEEYRVAQMYAVTKMQHQSRTDTEGVDILESRPFENSEFGKGHYTSKVYRLQSKVPAWLTAFAPADALILQEEAWNAYPRCKTVLKCPYFTKFSLTIETVHKADNGQSENVHGLSEEQLATRQVETIDIASDTTDYWSYAIGSSDVDLSKFKSARTGRGPLFEGWQSKCDPVMTAYKLLTVDAPYWGFGYRLEQAMLSGERALFKESHRNCFGWIDDWYGMTIQQVRELERRLLQERTDEPTTLKSAGEHEMRLPINNEENRSEIAQLKSDRRPVPVDQGS